MAKKTIKLEESFLRLEEILKILESGSTELEESIKLFEEGIEIVDKCKESLKALEKRVKLIIEKESGEYTEKDSQL